MADWRELYKTTLLETNPTQLERLMTETDDAIASGVRGRLQGVVSMTVDLGIV